MTWEQFTKRTDDPKLAWLELELEATGIPSRRNGRSFHAPILEVHEADLERAWEILTPVDDVPDDDEMFGTIHPDWCPDPGYEYIICPTCGYDTSYP